MNRSQRATAADALGNQHRVNRATFQEVGSAVDDATDRILRHLTPSTKRGTSEPNDLVESVMELRASAKGALGEAYSAVGDAIAEERRSLVALLTENAELPGWALPAPPDEAPYASYRQHRLRGSALEQSVRHVAAVIDRVHPVPADLPAVEFSVVYERERAGGYEDEQRIIGLRFDNQDPELTVAHEVFHHFVSVGLEDRLWAAGSSADQRAAEDHVLDAIKASPTWQHLADVANDRRKPEPERRYTEAEHTFADYASDLEESLCRAYAQWLAHRSGDELLTVQIAGQLALRHEHSGGAQTQSRLAGYNQWPAQEFAPIAAAMDRLLLGPAL